MNSLAYEQYFPGNVEEALSRLEPELRNRGFGILALLRLHEILREKTGARVDPVVVLEVCSPKHAEHALALNRDAALLLPCKVVISRERGSTRIALQRPTSLIAAFAPDPRLLPLSEEVESELRSAIDAAIP